MGTTVLDDDKAASEQANISLHWIFPLFANKLETSTAPSHFPSQTCRHIHKPGSYSLQHPMAELLR